MCHFAADIDPATRGKGKRHKRQSARGQEEKRAILSPGGGTTHSKTDIEEAVIGRRGVAIRGAATPRIEGPGTATKYAVCLFVICCPSTSIHRCFVVAIVVVLTPLQHISMHITQAKSISNLKLVNRCCCFSNFSFRSIHIGYLTVIISYLCCQRFAKVKRRGCPCPASIFPFSFAR